MERIQALRKIIEEIDERILYSLGERVEVCRKIGSAKQEHRIPIRDSNRENEVYKHIMVRAAEAGLNQQEVRAVYQRIIAMCLRVQEAGAV